MGVNMLVFFSMSHCFNLLSKKHNFSGIYSQKVITFLELIPKKLYICIVLNYNMKKTTLMEEITKIDRK